MTAWGALLGALAGAGLVLVGVRVRAIVRPPLSDRVLPWLRDLPALSSTSSPEPVSAAAGVFGPVLRSAAEMVERTLGGAASVRRRLERAGIDRTVHEFRIEQVVWGLGAFAVAAVWALLRAFADPSSIVASVVLCVTALVVGVLARDNRLSSQVKARERRMLEEFPTLAELLALAVSAGESPVVALERVVRRSGGEFSRELARVLADIRTGTPIGTAFDALASRTGLPMVARFAAGLAVAIERGTPLADVLHAQAADVREAGRRELIEVAARKEILMMVPVVFLVLPTTVLFAFYPGLLGLHLVTS
ncbi:type II secretion system F family protein [Nocardioides sp. Kera G14]|uniref:type II secretion system F family protein n=1 Tax=Nocardioides sp. Kera G14 TaxID=2884264 RepID=UPI001D123FC6|nr:type II secretion system F family protein [Nocardioides sp. Kera G14]UDY22811.1 type II secretion system F family protein [Nocardioides sp. Kera G14]